MVAQVFLLFCFVLFYFCESHANFLSNAIVYYLGLSCESFICNEEDTQTSKLQKMEWTVKLIKIHLLENFELILSGLQTHLWSVIVALQ